jgi:hypothetical protein
VGATDISSGGISLVIPSPNWLTPVTQDTTLLHDLQTQFVVPMHEQFIAFIPERDAAAVVRDEIPDRPSVSR